MPCHTTYFTSIGALLAQVDSTRDTAGHWRTDLPGALLSLKSTLCEDHLSTAVDRIRTGTGFEADIEAVETLLHQLRPTVRLTSQIRQQTTGRSGYAVRPHAVLSGNLAHAWKRTEVEARRSMRPCSVIVPLSYSSDVDPERSRWLMACSIALAAALKKAGYSVELLGVRAAAHLWGAKNDGLYILPLLASHEAWNLQRVVYPLYDGFLRRVLWRVDESLAEQYGPKTDGAPYRRNQIIDAVTVWAAKSNRRGRQAIYGACQEDPIYNQSSALEWLNTTLSNLEKAA